MQPKLFFIGGLALILAALVAVPPAVDARITIRKGMALVQLNRPSNVLLRGTLRDSRQERTYYAFYGVRYAKPPKRFERPEPLEQPRDSKANVTTVDTGEYGSSCARWSRFLRRYAGSEDCLFLNVFVSDVDPGKGLPVLVYIHGGAFADGESESHGPEFFMDESVILVTLNYRLGALGFLSTGTGEDVGGVPGNLGLHDQVLALRWVHDNIAVFGGDPEKVTLFGESAGGVAVSLHMLYQANRGLFSRAISQSGTAHSPWGVQHPKSARLHFEMLTKLSGCDADGEKEDSASSEAAIDCLRAKRWQDLLDAQNKTQKWFPGLSLPFAPVVEPKSDTAFLSEVPDFLMRTGQFLPVPYIVGVNEDEGYYVYSEVILKNGKLLRALQEEFNVVAPDLYYFTNYLRDPTKDADTVSAKVRNFYFGDRQIGPATSQGIVDLSSDRSFNVAVEQTAWVLAEAGHEAVYAYLFSFKGEHTLVASLMQEPEGSGNRQVVVSHADELQYLFKSQRFGSKEGFSKGSRSEQVSKQFVRLWAGFAEKGEPGRGTTWNNARMAYWKSVQKGTTVPWFELDWTPRVLEGYHAERHAFWRRLLADYFVNQDELVEKYLKVAGEGANSKAKVEL